MQNRKVQIPLSSFLFFSTLYKSLQAENVTSDDAFYFVELVHILNPFLISLPAKHGAATVKMLAY